MLARNKLFFIVAICFFISSCDSEDQSNVARGIVTGVAAGVASSATHHAIQSWKDRRAARSASGRGFLFRRR